MKEAQYDFILYDSVYKYIDYILYDSNSVVFWKWQNYGVSKMISFCLKFDWGEEETGEGWTMGILGNETIIMHDTLRVNICCYTSVKTHGRYKQ